MKLTPQGEQVQRTNSHTQQRLASSRAVSLALWLEAVSPTAQLGPPTLASQAVAAVADPLAAVAAALAYVEVSSPPARLAAATAARQVLLQDSTLLAAAAQVGVRSHPPTLAGT